MPTEPDNPSAGAFGAIHRAAHFQWRRVAAALQPGVPPIDIVTRYWDEVGISTARAYRDGVAASADPAEALAAAIVESSTVMGETAAVVRLEDGAAAVRHTACPWLEAHRKRGLLSECRPGCDAWFNSTARTLTELTGIPLKVETLQTMPDGDNACVRRVTSAAERNGDSP